MNKNLALYISANAFSLSGSWIHYVALYWLVFQLTHSPLMLGAISLISCLPILFFSSLGGVISDRLPRKKLLILLQSFSGLLAIFMSFLCKNSVSIAVLFIFCFTFGILSSVELPVKQTFIPNIIKDKKLMSRAISWNVIINHFARIVGPLICSFFLSQNNVYLAFAIDGLTYLISASVIYFITLESSVKSDKTKKNITMLTDGFAYIFRRKILFYTIITSSVCAFCIGPYTAQLPGLVNEIYINNSSSLAIFYVLTGAGGLAAAFVIRYVSSAKNQLPKSFFYGFLIASIALSVFVFSFKVLIGYCSLFFVTFGVVLASGAGMIFVQNYIEDEYRGRVMGFYQMLTMGILPISNILFGICCEVYTARNTFFVGSFVSLISIAFLFIYSMRAAPKQSFLFTNHHL